VFDVCLDSVRRLCYKSYKRSIEHSYDADAEPTDPTDVMEDPMSAAVAWELDPRPARPQLRLVPTGDAVAARPAAPVRLTRRGRLAITLTVAAVIAVFAFLMAPGPSVPTTTIDHAATVAAGQTLSEIAATQLPKLAVSEAVAQIQLANNLNTSDVHAGQTLLIPRVG
jgi:hypothetical protein